MKYLSRPNMVKLVLCIVLISVNKNSFAQGPYLYDTPLGQKIYGLTPAPVKETTIYAEQWGSDAIGYDGLTLVNSFEFNPDNSLLRLYAFTNQYAETYLEVFYKGKTIMLRRFIPGSRSDYYDYILFDPLFVASQKSIWTVKFYFTASFFWIQTTLDGQNLNYLSPVYFGVNTLHRTNMNDLIDANPYATIVLGDNNAPSDFFVKESSVHVFHYSELMADIESRLSWPSGIFLEENDEYFQSDFLY